MSGPPLPAVEVSSPSTRRYDRTVELDLYRERGVAAYRLVDRDVRPALQLAGDRQPVA